MQSLMVRLCASTIRADHDSTGYFTGVNHRPTALLICSGSMDGIIARSLYSS